MNHQKWNWFEKIFGKKTSGLPRFENPPPPPKPHVQTLFTLVEVESITRDGKLIKGYQILDGGWCIRSFSIDEFAEAVKFYDAVVEHGFSVRKNVIKEKIISSNF